MKDPNKFYTSQISIFEAQLAKAKSQLYASSMIRLTVFCLAGIALYLGFGNTKLIFGIVLVTIALFVYLVSRHSDLQYRRDRLETLLQINATELRVLNRDFHDLPEGLEFQDVMHHYCQDIDLFGRGSFYQYSNRTVLKQGSEVFSSILLENSIEDIDMKQLAIQELAKMPAWRQNFSAIASLVKIDTPYHVITKWLKAYKTFVPEFMRIVPIVFSLLSILLVTLYFMDMINGWVVLFWLLLGFGLTGPYLKKINMLSVHTTKIQSTFQQYQKLILELERTEFQESLLKEQQATVLHDTIKTSKLLDEFSRILNALDQRHNLVIAIFGNGFLLWDLMQCYKIERWIGLHAEEVEQWFNTIAFFDAYNSLGNFAFNHPSYVFPEVTPGELTMKVTGAGHPLLDPSKKVLNDYHLNKEQFLIITGANMAGKSTFLRTVSLQIVMANIGLPVDAKRMVYSPIKLITSMRTSDSLTDDESYFFSELKRLKFIVDEIQKDRYFIVLDEILKGTNSTDKALGSRKFIEKLVGSKSTGIIATHDLSLCKVAEEMPEVENYYFDAEIIDNELHFDYTFKKGICQNMNASFLLKKMEIVE